MIFVKMSSEAIPKEILPESDVLERIFSEDVS